MISLLPATWKKNNALLLAACFAVAGGCAGAQEAAAEEPSIPHAAAADDSGAGGSTWVSGANLSGSLRGSAWDIPSNSAGNRKIGIGEVWLKAAPRVGDAAVVMEGWARDTDVNHTNPATGTGQVTGMLREGYLSLAAGDADIRLGKQIIVWGKADQLNPTDNLTPRDNTLYIADIDDQRFGAMAARATYNFSGAALTGIWLPYFRPSKQPLPPIPGIAYSETVPGGSEFAFKLEQSGGAMDWSVSYFHGFDQSPDISIGGPMPGGMVLSLQHHRIRVLGADAATTAGRFGLRAEAAYTWTEDDAGLNPFVKNPFFYGVAGGDRTFFDYLNINLQYFVRHVANYSDPNAIADPLLRSVAVQQAVINNQLDRMQQGISLRVADKWLNETLEGEIAGVANFTRHDFMLRPRLAYAFDDHRKGTLGAYVYRGGNNTFFGLLRNRTGGFAEARYSF